MEFRHYSVIASSLTGTARVPVIRVLRLKNVKTFFASRTIVPSCDGDAKEVKKGKKSKMVLKVKKKLERKKLQTDIKKSSFLTPLICVCNFYR